MQRVKRHATPLLALFGLVILSLGSCSEIPEIDDPVIGIWSRTEVLQDNNTIREEWIFNDVYLGRYHRYENEILQVKSDFGWDVNQEIYTITYPGLEREPEYVIIAKNTETVLLKTLSGETLATRE